MKRNTYQLYEGIDLSFLHFSSDNTHFHHDENHYAIEINYCFQGRVGWKLNKEMSLYLGEGDLSINPMNLCFDSTMDFPLQYYEGMTITINLDNITSSLELLKDAHITKELLYQKFCQSNQVLSISQDKKIKEIFSDIYHAKEEVKIALYKLKIQELILYLTYTDFSSLSHSNEYQSQQTESIKEIHSFLTSHLEKRYTIEELSKQFYMSPSTIKYIFKAIYGLPIASYMKEYRIRYAMTLLKETDYSILDIAKMVGFQSQSKFTVAFKSITNMLPHEYRKL